MTEYHSMFERFLLVGSLAYLGACLAAMFIRFATIHLKKVKKPIMALMMLMTAYAGAKHYYRIKLFNPDPEVKNIYDHGSYVTNSYVHLEFMTIGLPVDAPIIFGYMPDGSIDEADFVTVKNLTRSEWERLYENDDGIISTDISWPYDGVATVQRWYLGTTYVAPPSVHTNGVLNCYGLKTIDGNALPKKTLVIEYNFLTYPPRQMGTYYDSVHDALNAEEFEGERIPYELEK